MTDRSVIDMRIDDLHARVEHLEKVMYTTNGSPGLIERVRVISRLLWVVLAVTSANLVTSDTVRQALKALASWFGG